MDLQYRVWFLVKQPPGRDLAPAAPAQSCCHARCCPKPRAFSAPRRFAVEWRMANDTDADLFPWILGTMDPGQRAYYHCRSRDINCLHSHASFEHSQNTKPKRHKRVASGTDGAAGSDTSPPAIQPAADDALPPGTVWECVVNGERTFSDAPCGARSSIRQLSKLNLMDSARVPPDCRSVPTGSRELHKRKSGSDCDQRTDDTRTSS
jgi:hypothetical protein